MRTRAVVLGLCVGSWAVSGAVAQSTLDWPVGELFPVGIDTGMIDNPTDAPALIYQQDVTWPAAAWLRLYFDSPSLPNGGIVRVMSALDGQTQELDADGLVMWSNSTAYFNGDALVLQVIAGPRTVGNRLVVRELAAQLTGAGGIAAPCGICGADDRVDSSADWSCRLMPVGCTASVYTEESCIVSAGHCAGGSNYVIQFRVPPSNADCSLNNPPVEEQFPVLAQNWLNAGVGADWAVMTTGLNNLGQSAYQRYRQLRPISAVLGNAGDTVRIRGYGVDSECVKSQTQQYALGPINSRASTYYTFSVDLRGGNSGSGLIRDEEIIAIVTHCTENCPNYGTRVDRTDFRTARNNLCPAVVCLPCDTNCDGSVNGGDIENFVDLLAGAIGCSWCAGDTNLDGSLNGQDIGGFIACLGNP